MTNPDLSRRALPPPLVVGLGLSAAHALLSLVVRGGVELPFSIVWVIATLLGMGDVLTAYGLWLLADRHAGAARRGLRAAAVASVVTILLQLAGELLIAFNVRWWNIPSVSIVLPYGTFGTIAATAIGLAVALWRRRSGLGVALLVVWIGGYVASAIGSSLLARLDASFRVMVMLELALTAARLGILVVVVRALAGESQDVDATRAGADLRRVARVLRVVVAAMIAADATLAVLASSGVRRAVTSTVAVALGIVVFAWLGLALLGAARDRKAPIAAYALALVAMLALGCSRMLLAVVPELCRSAPRRGEDMLGIVVFAVPVAAIVGSAMLAWIFSSYAWHSGRDELRRRATHHAYSVIAAVLVSPLLLAQLADCPDSVIASVIASAIGLFAFVVCVLQVALLARLCSATAQAVEGKSELPGARLIRA